MVDASGFRVRGSGLGFEGSEEDLSRSSKGLRLHELEKSDVLKVQAQNLDLASITNISNCAFVPCQRDNGRGGPVWFSGHDAHEFAIAAHACSQG